MDLKKFEKQLAKLNKLYAFISDDGGADEVEMDLLRSYVKKLGNTIQDEEEDIVEEKPKATAKKTAAKKAAPKVEVEEVEEAEEPEEIEIIEEVEELEEKELVAEPIAKAKPVKVKKTTKASTTKAKGQMGDLFSTFSSKELGDKLSQMPIKDLTKALSINEKIFTIKELFGGDADLFRSTLKEINVLGNFDEAKDHLMNGPAKKFDWTEEGKFKKARNFIKIIKRRFN